MFFQKIDWKLKWNFQSLPNWKYKSVRVSEWRSNLQNALYRGWYIPNIKLAFAEEGRFMSEDEIHESLKEIILQEKRFNPITWTYKKYIKSTKTMTKVQFVQYLKDVEYYMIDRHEIAIPPHDIDF